MDLTLSFHAGQGGELRTPQVRVAGFDEELEPRREMLPPELSLVEEAVRGDGDAEGNAAVKQLLTNPGVSARNCGSPVC